MNQVAKKTLGKKENRKEVIFDAAVACFNENGYYGTSMDMIAERASMTKRGLYYHFKSKDKLFIELFHYMNKRYYEQIPHFAKTVSGPEERLRMFVETANQVLKEGTDFIKFSQEFISISVRKPEIRKVMTTYYKEQVERVKNIVASGIEAGTFIQTDAEKVARSMVLITMGAFNVFFSLDAGYDLADQHSFNIAHILRGLKKQAH